MCQWGIEATQVRLAVPRSDGRTHAPVDPCIAALVQALNDAGIATVASCCGHGKVYGRIALADGRELFLAPNRQWADRGDWLLNATRCIADPEPGGDEDEPDEDEPMDGLGYEGGGPA